MAFTAKDVADLRAKTGCGMMDCKKALTESNGDIQGAIDYLREKGLAAATKKAGRIAAEGMAYAALFNNEKVGVVIEVNAETDFVAKNAEFQAFVKVCAQTVADNNPANLDALLACTASGTDKTVDALLKEKILVIGENIKIRRFDRFEGVLTDYIHMGGKIAVMVKFDTTDEAAAKPEFKEYQTQIVKNAAVLAQSILEGGLDLVSGGTDNHLMLVDLRPAHLTGKEMEHRLDEVYITVNKNAIPNDPEKPFVTSGIRVGTPAVTSRGFREEEMKVVGSLICQCAQADFESKIDDLRAFVAEAGLETGGTGSKVRPVVACKGTTCQYGLLDSFDLSQKIHERFYKGYESVKLPHKFKIAVGGCPNNCVKPNLNDLGIVGQRVPKLKEGGCKGCASCSMVPACPMDAISMEGKQAVIDREKCNNCGRCAGTCRFDALEESETMYKVYVGGRWGKKVRMGTPLNHLFTREEVIRVVEKAILLFKYKGISGERFGETVDRLGVDKVEKMLVSDNLLKRKEENSKIGRAHV